MHSIIKDLSNCSMQWCLHALGVMNERGPGGRWAGVIKVAKAGTKFARKTQVELSKLRVPSNSGAFLAYSGVGSRGGRGQTGTRQALHSR